jgi:hypothetical protein
MVENILATGKLDVLPAVTHVLPPVPWKKGD